MIQPNVKRMENLINLSFAESKAIQDNIESTVPSIQHITNP